MRTPSYAHQFERDLRQMEKRGKNTQKIKAVIVALVSEETLPEQYRDHILVGNFKDRRECHIEPDWLLIHRLQDHEIVFERTGSHADLFR